MPIHIDKSHEVLRWEDYRKESQSTLSAFGCTGIGQSGFGGHRSGSRVVNYAPIAVADCGTPGQTTNLWSISSMPIYKDKSHEELRWDDYKIGDKGGPLSPAQSTGLVVFNSPTTQTNTFAPSPASHQWAAYPFSTSTPSNPFALKSSPVTTGGFVTSSIPACSSSTFSTSTSAPVIANSIAPFGLGRNILSSSASLTSSNLTGLGPTTPSPSPPFQTGQAPQTYGTFAFSNFGQTQPDHRSVQVVVAQRQAYFVLKFQILFLSKLCTRFNLFIFLYLLHFLASFLLVSKNTSDDFQTSLWFWYFQAHSDHGPSCAASDCFLFLSGVHGAVAIVFCLVPRWDLVLVLDQFM